MEILRAGLLMVANVDHQSWKLRVAFSSIGKLGDRKERFPSVLEEKVPT